MKISRVIERTFTIGEAIDLRDGEMESFLAKQGVQRVDQLLEGDWAEIWDCLKNNEEDPIEERIYDPLAKEWFGNTSYDDNVITYLYNEEENNNE
jgi:hypothetical protein